MAVEANERPLVYELFVAKPGEAPSLNPIPRPEGMNKEDYRLAAIQAEVYEKNAQRNLGISALVHVIPDPRKID